MSISTIQFKHPFPSRRAASALREQLVSYLVEHRPSVGSPFLTDSELVRLSALSRSTVRRALDDLHRDGWIERRIGQGTFIGPRLGSEMTLKLRASSAEPMQGSLRLAVLIFGIGDLANDWYTPLVLEGIDDSAEQYGVTVELIGNGERGVEAISRRITQNPPDVLACLASDPRQALVMRDAQRLGVRCIVTGTPHMDLGFPTVTEDNRQSMQLAVDHLLSLGHRRIALLIERVAESWVMQRHQTFCEMMSAMGVEPLVHWTPIGDPRTGSPESQESVLKFIQAHSPTAVIPGSYLPMLYLDRLARARQIDVPGQLSLVSMEQDVPKAHWFGDMQLTYVRFPMRQIGRTVTEWARRAVNQEELPPLASLPSELIVGQSTRKIG